MIFSFQVDCQGLDDHDMGFSLNEIKNIKCTFRALANRIGSRKFVGKIYC